MAVKCVRKYQADDDRVFDTQAEALAHNAQSKAMLKLRSALTDPKLGRTTELLAVDLTSNPVLATQVRDALNKVLDYHRQYGKLKKSAPDKP